MSVGWPVPHRLYAVVLLAFLGGCILNEDAWNRPPVINRILVDPSPVYADSTATVSVEAWDPNRDPLSYEWRATAGSFSGETDGAAVLWIAPSDASVCTVTVIVGDGRQDVRGDLEIVVDEWEPEGERIYTYEVVHTYPHDSNAWTQGLIFHDGFLYEGTGITGSSSLRKVDLETGTVLERRDIPRPYYGEGITLFEDRFLQLTWQSHVGFIYEAASFDSLGRFTYPTEGWGLTHDGTRLIMSDGNPKLHFLDPDTFAPIGEVSVSSSAGPLQRINELEYIDGEVWANVWLTDRIARINPATGNVTGWIELQGLLTPEEAGPANVLNGIAWDAEGERLFVTGKWWPWVFEIRIREMGEEGGG